MRLRCMYYHVFITISCICRAAILRVGNPLGWLKSKSILRPVRYGGVEQFINHYKRTKEIETPLFLWGDEIEYGVFSRKSDRFDLSLRGATIRQQLEDLESECELAKTGCTWQPEYGAWMVEAVPRDPYGGYVSDLLSVEKNMQMRRARLHSVLRKDEIAPSTSNFPMLGVAGYAHCATGCGGPISASRYVPDNIINPHPRFGALTQNIRLRRERNVDIRVPKEKQEQQSQDSSELSLVAAAAAEGSRPTSRLGAATITAATEERPQDEEVHMDAMAFGMGCCCLQVTMQSRSERESRFLHDQLAIISPQLMALSASTPIHRGTLCDTDTRWGVISQAVDDRTAAESGLPPMDHPGRGADQWARGAPTRGSASPAGATGIGAPDPLMAGGGVRPLAKSRYSTVSLFIGKAADAAEQAALDRLNDIGAELDDQALQQLRAAGIDDGLARHVAHLFTRDPLVIFDDSVYLDDAATLDHFDNIQSTNWRSIRWKPPALEVGLAALQAEDAAALARVPLSGGRSSGRIDSVAAGPGAGAAPAAAGPGWRVEFRALEVQLTDFENAAYALLVVLATRATLALGYNFYLPMSLVEENMRRAQLRDAARTQRFFVRRNALRAGQSHECATGPLVPAASDMDVVELSLNEFINGQCSEESGGAFPGLVPAVLSYLDSLGCSKATVDRIQPYLRLLQCRAAGQIPTAARWLRDQVKAHPAHRGDGLLQPATADHVLQLCEDVGMGRVQRPDLVGEEVNIKRLCPDEAWNQYLSADLQTPSRTPQQQQLSSETRERAGSAAPGLDPCSWHSTHYRPTTASQAADESVSAAAGVGDRGRAGIAPTSET